MRERFRECVFRLRINHFCIDENGCDRVQRFVLGSICPLYNFVTVLYADMLDETNVKRTYRKSYSNNTTCSGAQLELVRPCDGSFRRGRRAAREAHGRNRKLKDLERRDSVNSWDYTLLC